MKKPAYSFSAQNGAQVFDFVTTAAALLSSNAKVGEASTDGQQLAVRVEIADAPLHLLQKIARSKFYHLIADTLAPATGGAL